MTGAFDPGAFDPSAFDTGTTITPPVLFDPVVGNIGLIGESVVLLHLEEKDGIYPSDAAGNLEDLAPDGSTTMPSSVSCWAGKGRRFVQASETALVAVDNTNRDTLLVREVSIQAIIAITVAGTTGTQTLFQRGNHSSGAEAISFGIELEPIGDTIELRWFWEDSAGVIHVQSGGAYTHPGDGQFVLITATRRWESTGKVVVRYYAADQLLGEITSSNGDIAGGTTGHTMIGGRHSAGAWSNFLNADLDELRVVDYEMSGDEVRETWRRLYVHQPAGVAMFAGLIPPGSRWYDNPSNNIGRLVKLVGQSLGLGIAKNEALRATWLPDACDLDTAARWERVCGLSPRPRDSLDVRRARIIAYLSRIRGYSLPALQQAFSTVFLQAAADVEILEFSNLIVDPFDEMLAERWNYGEVVDVEYDAGNLLIDTTSGHDLRWDPTRAQSIVRTPIASSGRNVSLGNHGERFIAQVKLLADIMTLPVGVIAGLYIQNRVDGATMWLGAKNVAGTVKIGYQIFEGGVMGAFVTLVTPALSTPYWLRLRPPVGTSIGGITEMLVGYSTTGPTSGFIEASLSTGVEAEWAGVAVCSDTVIASSLNVRFDDFILLSYAGDRPFNWYAYRDPALAGTPDIVGAEILALKMRPAHTYAAAITSKSVLCDDPRDGLCDRGPLGAF